MREGGDEGEGEINVDSLREGWMRKCSKNVQITPFFLFIK